MLTLVGSELVIYPIAKRGPRLRVSFDPKLIPRDELAWMSQRFSDFKQLLRSGRIDEAAAALRELVLEGQRIIDRATRGDGRVINPIVFDPAMNAAPGFLVGHVSKDVGQWWCDGGQTGKYFTKDLASDPCLDECAKGRRAVAFNPWTIEAPGDLDTIIDTSGANKEGTIGTSPMSINREVSNADARLTGSFTAASSTTIQSVVLLLPTAASRGCPTEITNANPSPLGTCSLDLQCSVYLALYGWDINFSISEGYVYGFVVRFYV